MMRITDAVRLIGALALTVLACGQATGASGRDVDRFVRSLEVGEPLRYQDLTVVPVYAPGQRPRVDVVTLDLALERKLLKITEVEGGRVPQVAVSNLSDRYVFLMGGEILTGCRQDRIVGRDVLVGPRHTDVIVPVYCVEAGRWTYESDQFYSKSNLGTAGLRAEAQKASEAAQTRIWDQVSDIHVRGGRAGETRFQVVFESDDARRRIAVVEERLAAIPRLYPDAVGVVIGLGDRIVSADIFVSPEVFGPLWPKILRSAAVGTAGRGDSGSISQNDAARFLRGLYGRRYVERTAVDLGSELAAADGQVNVNALVHPDRIFHLAAFPEDLHQPVEKDNDPERRIPVWMRQ
jgi:hypothetical protein